MFNSKEWVQAQLKRGLSLSGLARAMKQKGIKASRSYLCMIAKGQREFSRKLEREIREKWS